MHFNTQLQLLPVISGILKPTLATAVGYQTTFVKFCPGPLSDVDLDPIACQPYTIKVWLKFTCNLLAVASYFRMYYTGSTGSFSLCLCIYTRWGSSIAA
jgi:hypothetical protein